MDEAHAVIMAGGRGERLWPLSTSARPKQFLPILNGKSFLQHTVERIKPLIPEERIFVVTPREFAHLVREELTVPEENIILEPVGKNTALCAALAAFFVAQRDPKPVMAVLPADHVIKNVDRFRFILAQALEIAGKWDYLITLGIVPDRPATGYGYIRLGLPFKESPDLTVFHVEKFKEKPDRKTAERFLAEGGYFWNSGMFVARADVWSDALSQHLPTLFAALRELRTHLGQPTWENALEEAYQNLPSISIDQGVMEKAENVLVIPADIGWSDVGDWAALGDLLPQDGDGNALHARHLGLETKGCVIYAEDPGRLVATLGVEDLVIVETKEGLLVLPKERAQEVRKLLEKRQNG